MLPILGFSQKQLEMILRFCKVANNDPKIFYSEFHRKYSPFSRVQSTINTINKAYQEIVLSGPFIYCNNNIDVILMEECECDPHELLAERENDPNSYFTMALYGDWEFICFHKGASMLQYADVITPVDLTQRKVKDLYFDEPGKLERDPYPCGWDELDWELYGIMGEPRKITFREVGKELGIPWSTVRERYNNILKQCKKLTCFFPLGYRGYHYLLVTFKTAYETGLVKSLKKLGRTTYLYKFSDTILLVLFLLPEALSYNDAIKNFKHLEKIGIIYDLRISSPMTVENKFI
jgi:hypothetical protein